MFSLRLCSVLPAIAIIFLNVDCAKVYSKPTLQLVQVLFRHGDRNPIWKYPNDPYLNESMFTPDEMGELTNVGKIQHYELGKFLRKRYDGFLSQNYSRHEIMIHSSEADRCIMSAEMNLAGIYHPTDLKTNWNSEIQWTPTPLRTIPRAMDKTLGMGKPCPKYDRLKHEIRDSEEVKKFNDENIEFTKFVSKHSGINAEGVGGITFIHDILTVEEAHGYKLPNWTNGIMDKFAYIAGMDLKLHTGTKEIQRLRGGPLLKQFLGSMEETVHSSSNAYLNPKKFIMYSAHDSTVAYFLNSLDIFDPIMPTYASAVIVELHKDTDNDYFVEVYFRNQSNREPYQLQIPRCTTPCYLNKLVNITRDVISENWEQECEDDDNDSALFQATNSPIIRLLIIMFSIVFSMSTLVFMIKKKKVIIVRPPLKSTRSSSKSLNRSSYERI